MERPAFLQVPVAGGGEITAVVANRDGIAEVILNGVPHIGLLLSVNASSATIAVLTPQEAAGIAQRLSLAALTLARRLGGTAAPERPRIDLTDVQQPVRIRHDDIGAHLFEILDEKGQPMSNVVEVDTEAGWARVELLDDQGAPVVENDGYVVIRVRGTYSIRRRQA